MMIAFTSDGLCRSKCLQTIKQNFYKEEPQNINHEPVNKLQIGPGLLYQHNFEHNRSRKR